MTPVREPRWQIAAVLAAVVMLAAAGLVAGRGGDNLRPEDAVRAYLAAVRRGDVEQALRIVGEPEVDASQGSGPAVDTSLLTAEALADDWRVEQVVRRYPWRSGPAAVVDVTLSTPEGISADGRFYLTRDPASGRWSMDDPFVEVQPVLGALGHVEINGAVRPAGEQIPVYLVFPGVYRGWTGLAELFAGGQPPTVVALPSRGPHQLAPSELSPAGQAAAQRAVNAYLDECAESTELQPSRCPFAGGDLDRVSLGDAYYRNVADIGWEIVTYPRVLLVPDIAEFGVIPRREGTVRLTGTGLTDDDDREAFSAECATDVSPLRLTLTRAGAFEVTARENAGTC